MIKSGNKIELLAQLLNKENTLVISGAIDSLRNEEPFEGAVGLLVSLYDRTSDDAVKKTIELFLNDIKDPSSRTEVIDQIKKTWKPGTTSMLVSSCWQSGLDYSGYSDVFISLFLSGDFVTAIECYTVISESADSISRVDKDAMIKTLEDNQAPQSGEKASLAADLISMLKDSL